MTLQYIKDLYREYQIMWLREKAIRACIWGDKATERKHTLAMYKLIASRSPQQVRRMEKAQGIYRGR
jgi:hypothetical protein